MKKDQGKHTQKNLQTNNYSAYDLEPLAAVKLPHQIPKNQWHDTFCIGWQVPISSRAKSEKI